MDTALFLQLSDVASELSQNELTPVTSSEGEYVQAPFSPTDLQAQAYPYETSMAHDLYQQQQFDHLHYQPTHGLFPMDTTQLWIPSTQPQSYTAATSSPRPERPITARLSATSATCSPLPHGYVLLAKRPSLARSMHSTPSDGDEQPTPDPTSERRRQRRRAQNRAAQRAFRARKEETIKDSCTRLSALQAELTHLQAANTALSSTISTLRARTALLQRENTQLKRHGTGNIDVDVDWATLDLSPIDMASERMSPARVPPPLKTAGSYDSGVDDGAATQHPESPGRAPADAAEAEAVADRTSAAMIASAIADAAATLLRRSGRAGPEHVEADA